MKGERRRPFRGMPFRRGPSGKATGTLRATVRALAIILVVLGVLAGSAIYSITRRGLSTHDQPSRVEELIARTVRSWATPQAVRERTNPVAPTPEALDEALQHYADHCAMCHGADGSGNTEMGRGLYPKAPDMRTATTQSLSDGELFWIIEHGIRLTGMPGWSTGTADGERQSWGLVHVIRRIPQLTPEDIERIESLTPRSQEAWQQEEEIRRFLAGEDTGQ